MSSFVPSLARRQAIQRPLNYWGNAMRTYSTKPLESLTFDHIAEETGIRAAARAALEGRSRGLRAILPFLGPAFIASVAYIDPGNFATNIQGGSAFGYNLLWVIALAN